MIKIKHKTLKTDIFIYILILSSFLFSEIKTGKYLCVGVSDGDSIWFKINGYRVRVKIDGVDCPELGQDFGKNAKEFTSALVYGKVIEVNIIGFDKSKTPFAYMLVDKGDVGLELLKAGLAWNLKGTKNDDPVYSIVENEVKANKIGLWSKSNPIAPWEFRKDALKLINDDYKKTQKPVINDKFIETKKPETAEAPSISEKIIGSSDEVTNESMSIYEEKRKKGLELFENEIILLAKKADQMDIEYTRYKDACLNKSTAIYSRGRNWFSVWDGYTYVDNESLPECKKIWSDFTRLTREIKAGIEFSMEMARKAGVYPGQMRKVREKYYLDWSGWD